MSTITWVVEEMKCSFFEDGYTNVVKTVYWRCNGEDAGFNGTIYSSCSLPNPKSNFIAYASLTENTVLDWCWSNGVDKDATETAVQAQIATAKNPPIVQPPLPWA